MKNKPLITLGAPRAADVPIYILLLFAMTALNFIGENAEPFSLSLGAAMLTCGFNAPLTCLSFLIAGTVALKNSPLCFFVFAMQALWLFITFSINRKAGRQVKADCLIYCAIALLPFIFLSPFTGYAFLPLGNILQKSIISGAVLLSTAFYMTGLKVIMYKLLRAKLRAEETLAVSIMAITLGFGLFNLCGANIYTGISIAVILAAALILKGPECLIFGIISAIPAVVLEWRISYMAAYVIYAAACLLFCREGKYVTAITCLISYLAAAYFYGVYALIAWPMVYYILSGAVPCLIAALIPTAAYQSGEKAIKRYKEKELSRLAINRNRSVVGDQLFEVASLFRQIEGTFFTISENADAAEAQGQLVALVRREMCAGCERAEKCRAENIDAAIDRLIRIGCGKGKVSIIDLPKEISAVCANPSGLLFAINKRLREYIRFVEENAGAASGRSLLAEQAHGISEVLKNLALEQSRPVTSYTEKERDLLENLAREGIAATDVLIYGDEARLTVSLTVFGKYDAADIIAGIEKTLGLRFALSEKIVISHDKFCYIFRLKTKYDAMFGVAAKTKDGENVSGDTHTVIKIDERRFIVALADGSGSGESARSVSDATISLLESFYRAKMPSDTILSTVNKLLTFTDGDSFACLDLACISLDDGSADIVKLGAPLGFIFSESEIKVIECESLPIGAIETLKPSTARTKMGDGDVLVFLSDGVSDAFSSTGELFDYIKDFTPLNPQKLADEILNRAYALNGNAARDDMTVVAVRLFGAL